MVRARFLAIGAGVCLQPPRGDLVTVLGTLGRARWRGRGRSKRPSRTGLARVCGDVGSVADGSSRRKWQGAQPGQGAAELLLPRPMLRKMQSEAACRADEPSGQGEDPLSEGLGGHDRLAQTEPGCPAGQVVRHHVYRQPGGVGGEAARGEMVQPDAVLQVPDGILDLGVAAMAGFQLQGFPLPAGDEAVIAVGGEEGQLGTGRGLHPQDDEPYRRGVRLSPEGGVEGVSEVQVSYDIRCFGSG